MGYEEHEIGNSFKEWEDLLHPDDRELSMAKAAEYVASGLNHYETEFRLRHKNGEYIWILSRASCVRHIDGQPVSVFGIHIDITERKKYEMELRLLETAVEHLNDLVVITKAEPLTYPGPEIVFVNAAASRLTGYSKDELVGHSARRIHPGTPTEEREKQIEADLVSGKHVRLESKPCTKSGETVWLETEIIPVLDKTGMATHWVSIERDITERKREAAAKQELELQLRATQKMEAIGTLAAGIAHDFNNLLAAISGNLDLAYQDAEPGSSVTISLAEISKSTSRAKILVEQLLTFSRQKSQQFDVQEIGKVIEESIALVRAIVPPSIHVTSELCPLASLVLVNSTQINQVIVNLGINAWQSISSENGLIKISLDRLDTSNKSSACTRVLPDGPYIRLRVADNGMGISPQSLERIFEPFYTTKDVGKGTGLGLSVAHGIIAEQGGAILVESGEGIGSTFDVYLPYVEPSGIQNSLKTLEPKEPTKSGHHILFVDDEEAMVFVVKRILERRGYRVTACDCPDQALAEFTHQPQEFDLVVTDHNMPGTSGLELARKLLDIRPSMPIAIISGFVSDDLIKRAKALGIDEIIYKPSSVEDICESIAKLIESSASSA